MKKFLSGILIVCMLLSVSACDSYKNKDEDKTENDSNITSQSDNDLKEESPFTLDAKPVDGKEYIGDGFAYIIYDDNSIEIVSYTGNEAEISIPSKIDDYPISRIAPSAFENCIFLKEINIWADVIIIGESAFKGCTSLKEISIPSFVSEIYDSTFEGCTNLKEANIWGDVVRIGVNAFKNCVSLKEISIPSSCLLVDKSAFEGCTDMEKINLWGGEVIGEYAFKNCTSLKEISIPSEVTTVKESAFEGCKSLKEVNVWGDNVTFGVNVFTNCPKLEELPDGAYPDGVYSDNISNISQNDKSFDDYLDGEYDNDYSNTSQSGEVCDATSYVNNNSFIIHPAGFAERFEEQSVRLNNIEYSAEKEYNKDMAFYDAENTVYYRIKDVNNNYSDIGIISFNKTNGETLPISNDYSENSIGVINILIEKGYDVSAVVYSAILAIDPNIGYSEAADVGQEIVDNIAIAVGEIDEDDFKGVDHNGINYLLYKDRKYHYLIIKPI